MVKIKKFTKMWEERVQREGWRSKWLKKKREM